MLVSANFKCYLGSNNMLQKINVFIELNWLIAARIMISQAWSAGVWITVFIYLRHSHAQMRFWHWKDSCETITDCPQNVFIFSSWIILTN